MAYVKMKKLPGLCCIASLSLLVSQCAINEEPGFSSQYWLTGESLPGECLPDCDGKECGDDGCGGSCGPGCWDEEVCIDGLCACVPSCAGKECGGDGCVGSCGECSWPLGCTGAGSCQELAWNMVSVPAGCFQMGSPSGEEGRDSDEQQHEVCITKGFYLKETEVTQGEWQELMGNNPSYFSSCGDTCPVESVSWWDAVAYANALSNKEELESCYTLTGCEGIPGEDYTCTGVTFKGLACKGYRLPTEAEWEYAARAGSTGATYGSLEDVAWYTGNSSEMTHPVAQLEPNAWGFYDMLGNVWEWCGDWYDSGYYGSSPHNDPLGPDSGSYRVSRGGSWDYDAGYVRAAIRYGYSPGNRYGPLGFRLSRSQ